MKSHKCYNITGTWLAYKYFNTCVFGALVGLISLIKVKKKEIIKIINYKNKTTPPQQQAVDTKHFIVMGNFKLF